MTGRSHNAAAAPRLRGLRRFPRKPRNKAFLLLVLRTLWTLVEMRASAGNGQLNVSAWQLSLPIRRCARCMLSLRAKHTESLQEARE